MNYINQKQALLEQILENTKSQTSAIQEEELEKLDELIAKRGILMQEVDHLDQGASELLPTIPQGQLEPLRVILKEITLIDNQNQANMQKAFEEVKTELRKIRLAKQRNQTYGNEYGLHVEEGLMFDTK